MDKGASTVVERLCRYYLECLGHDYQGGASVFARSKHGPQYAELQELPQISKVGPFNSSAAQQLLKSYKKDAFRLQVSLGYPCRLRYHKAKSGWQGFFLEPVLLFPFESDKTEDPELQSPLPQLNLEMLKWLTGLSGGDLIHEALAVQEEMGLLDEAGEEVELDQLVQSLYKHRSNWDWKEVPDPSALSTDPRLADVQVQGIHNRAVLLLGERSSFTRGLEAELAQVRKIGEGKLARTALGNWISGPFEPPGKDESESTPLLEVLPLNSEQRAAVERGLTQPLTVITGPPGTGKSQVVSSLLINAAWRGQRALFASKNNKAVDVVEVRINSLGPRPILLRSGAKDYQTLLADFLTALLAASTTTEEKARYEEAKEQTLAIAKELDGLQTIADATIDLRNQADALDQELGGFRDDVGAERFSAFSEADLRDARVLAERFSLLTRKADRARQGPFVNALWSLFRRARFTSISRCYEDLRPKLPAIAVVPEDSAPTDSTITEWQQHADLIRVRIELAARAQDYFGVLTRLRDAPTLEAVSEKRASLQRELAAASDLLWSLWLRITPGRLNPTDRKLIGDYATLLKSIVKINAAGDKIPGKLYKKYLETGPKVVDILPCWAITSLSAHRRIPLEPGFFDLLIIDEASQCDIASALPLLLRAKRSVIIGDPNQLSHISTLSENQDMHLLERNKLTEDHLRWMYSVNSLFDLASQLARSEDIVFLRDHHRSHEDIIGFSNQHFYERKLRIATNYDRLRRPWIKGPAVRWVHTQGQAERPGNGGARNRAEADAVVLELRRLLIEQSYKGSVGVVTPFRAQANLIRQRVLGDRHLGAVAQATELLIDTAHRFQGDERDLMLFSPVVARGLPRGAEIFLKRTQKVFNVAITRARAGLVVVGDRSAVTSCDIKHLSSFARYVTTLDAPPVEAEQTIRDFGPTYPAVSHPERVSDWERLFYQAMYARGLRPIPQYDVEKYTLDFALFGEDGHKLDIEIDGERYHRRWDGELTTRDQLRNMRLIELGWDVMRFWVYQVRDDLEFCLAKIEGWRGRGRQVANST